MPARVTERMPEKNAYMVHGFGHRAKRLKIACCTGGNDTDVIHDYVVDPISGATGMRTQFITIHPLQRAEELYPCASQ